VLITLVVAGQSHLCQHRPDSIPEERHCNSLCCCVLSRTADAGARARLARQLTAFEWAHEPALQAALAAAGGLPPPAEVRPDDGAGWALRSRRGHLLQVTSCSCREIPSLREGCRRRVAPDCKGTTQDGPLAPVLSASSRV